MKTFLAAFLGFLAAGVLLLAVLLVLGGSNLWQRRAAKLVEWVERERPATPTPRVDREAARLDVQRRRADRDREDEELQEQRRERLALLTATLRVKPIARVGAAETHLFQESERQQVRVASDALLLELIEPVQIDQWTVLQRGTMVEFVRADHDNAITIRHEGAQYQVSPCQTELRAISGDVVCSPTH
ncbi:MAG TPA: hypothetical protein VK993_11475 [Chthoniobacterales bacterium]|nr:hypothetical protein [Chthoniobacterales bacterium]